MYHHHPEDYQNPYGYWHVTTEADVEGRITRDLGVFEGYLDEIAFRLASESFYSLQFTRFEFTDLNKFCITSKAKTVQVTLDIDSGTWDMTGPDRVDFVRKMLADRNVGVSEGKCYASVTLHRTAQDAVETKRKAALAKLTAEEKALLGLKEE